MPVILTLPPPETNVWYLAYGSNLSSSKFVHDRGIVPLASVVVAVPGFVLAMESAGLPYREPSFASIRPVDECTHHIKTPELVGTAYLVTPGQYRQVISSEGGATAYREVEVDVVAVGGGYGEKEVGVPSVARTLVTVMLRRPAPRPSKRYKDLIVTGANEALFPAHYQEYLNSLPTYTPPTESGYRKVGAAIFLAIWTPVMMLMERITKLGVAWNNDPSGEAPAAVVWMVRTVMAVIWWHHDVHALVWGRGDGLDQTAAQG